MCRSQKRVAYPQQNSVTAWETPDVRLLTMQLGRDTGGPEGPSESEPVGLVPVLAKRSRPSGYIVDTIPALSGTSGARWPLPASPPVSRLGLAWRRRGAGAQTDVPSDGGRLRSKQGASIVQPTSADDV